MNLFPLANRLQTASLGIKGKTLFLEMMPADSSSAILLRNPLAGTKIDHELPDYFYTNFQLIVRSLGYDDGALLVKQVVAAMTFGELELEGQSFKFCRARTLPVAFPLSKGNLVEYNVTFDCAYCEAT
ncbi:minor capsid protein [Polaromonas sp. P1(28)-13]|nr:minor capsid protein [Polaromonas sp. P1(28)-13]